MPKTYIQRSTADHPGVTGQELRDLKLDTASADTVTTSIVASGTSVVAISFASSLTEPGVATWPNGLFQVQFDVTAAGVDLSYFADFIQLGSGGTFGASQRISQSDFSGTGLKSGSVTHHFTGAISTSRFGLWLRVTNANTMKAQDITLRVNTADSYAEGPWESGAPAAPRPQPILNTSRNNAVHRASGW